LDKVFSNLNLFGKNKKQGSVLPVAMPLIKSFSLVFELAIGQQVLAFVLSSCNTLCFQGIKGALSQGELSFLLFFFGAISRKN